MICTGKIPPVIVPEKAFEGNTPDVSTINLQFPVESYNLYSTALEFKDFNFVFSSGTETGTGGFSGTGSGTEVDPYLIFNPIHLYDVRNFIGKAGVVFKLMADIDLTSFLQNNNPTNGWEPIGTNSAPFMGKFYGEGHKITGFKIARTSNYVGLFGCTNGATINNLTVEGSSVSGGNYTGVIAGATIKSTLTNVTGNASVNGNSYVGGFVGLGHESTLSRCYHTGTVVAADSVCGGFAGALAKGSVTTASHKNNVTGGKCTGGFVGTNNTILNSITCTGDVTGGKYVGGIAGVNSADFTTGTHTGKVTGQGTNTGGFTGLCRECTVTGYTQTGDIIGSGGGYVGGFAGDLDMSTVTKSNFSGSVTAGGKDYVAGFCGRAMNNSSFANCKAYHGNIKGGTYVAGFIGQTKSTTITNCFAENNVEATLSTVLPKVGGFIGTNEGNLSVTNSGSIGDVKALSYNGESDASGFIGYSNGGTQSITNSYAVGDITCPGNYCGGIIGYQASGEMSITGCYYSGNLNVETSQYVGGIVGKGDGTVNINKSYASGSINSTKYTGGIAGYISSGSINSSFAIQSSLNASSGTIGRIYGYKGSSVSIGENGTNVGNIASEMMSVVSQGLPQTMSDNIQNGTTVGSLMLKRTSTYQGKGWNFSTDWTIQETESYPYKPVQCAPPVFSSALSSGMTTITGRCTSGATVSVIIDGVEYQATTNATNWTVSVPTLKSGTTVRAYAETSTLVHSYFVSTVVGYAGSGTESDPYRIYTADDLANINSYSYYKVMNDIDLTSWINTNNKNEGWKPIGIDGGGTMKQLDGGGHTITGLWINSSLQNIGLVSSISNATIKDITVKIATGKSVTTTKGYAGVIAGKADNCVMSNCNVIGGTLSATENYVGGVAGYATGSSFSNCIVNGVTATCNTHIGGIAGYTANDTFTNCNVSGSSFVGKGNYAGGIASGAGLDDRFVKCTVEQTTIGGQSSVGGIAGRLTKDASGLVVKDVTINATGTNVGGIAGWSNCAISQCEALISLTGLNAIGGIVGYTSGSIAQCKSEGTINSTNTETSIAGGIVGNTTGTISDCYSSANVNGGQYVGGIAGYTTNSIDKCYASGNLSAKYYAAGIIGYLDGTNAKTNNSFAMCKIIDIAIQTGTVMRIIGGFKNGAPVPAATNYALNTMVISVNGVTQTIYDDILEGIGVSDSQLKQQNTYAKQGWDFNSTWKIDEGQGYPYLQWAIPVVNATSIKLNRAELALITNETSTLIATVLPDNTTNKSVTWSTSNKAVATVDENGMVTAVAPGTATITVKTADGTNLTATCKVTVTEPEPEFITGDANGDGFVRINDVVATVNYIVNGISDNFNAKAADVNEDEQVRINDVVLIVGIIVNGPNSAPAKVAAMQLAGNDYMTAQGVEIKAGETRFIDIELNNDNAFSAMQMDINLPDGLVLKGATLTGRADGHNLVVGNNMNGKVTMAMFSAENSNFMGNNGAVIRLEVMATDNVNEDITLDNIFASTAKGELKQLEAVTVGVNTVTGINDITVNNGPVNVYNVAGQLIRRNVNASEAASNLPAGIYIIDNKKVVVK